MFGSFSKGSVGKKKSTTKPGVWFAHQQHFNSRHQRVCCESIAHDEANEVSKVLTHNMALVPSLWPVTQVERPDIVSTWCLKALLGDVGARRLRLEDSSQPK